MIKAIIFDVGGVLIRTEDYSHRRQLEKRLGLAAWESETLVFSGEMGIKAQNGAITTAELWAWIGDQLDLSAAELQAFQDEFWAGDVLDTALIEMIRGLNGRYQTAIISNASDTLRHALAEQHKIADAFDLIVCSAEEKVMKPRPEIYQRTLERLECQPEEAVFIDDFPENITAARELGLHTIHFQKDTDLTAVLRDMGITI